MPFLALKAKNGEKLCWETRKIGKERAVFCILARFFSNSNTLYTYSLNLYRWDFHYSGGGVIAGTNNTYLFICMFSS
jgi:hypothetical protein